MSREQLLTKARRKHVMLGKLYERQQQEFLEGPNQERTYGACTTVQIRRAGNERLPEVLKCSECPVDKKKKGRPRCTKSLVDRNILRLQRENLWFTAVDILQGISLSRQQKTFCEHWLPSPVCRRTKSETAY